MPTIVWILLWVAVIAVVAFLTVREVRAGRGRSLDVNRHQHEAVREAERQRDLHGPNGASQTWSG